MDFVAADVALLRAAAAPLRPLVARPTDSEPPTAQTFLAAASADVQLRTAIAVANPRVAVVLTGAAAGRFPDKPSRLRRAALAVAAYDARLHGRPTPHGLFAGVAGIQFDDDIATDPGPRRITVRPDEEWLVGVVAALESDLEVLAALTVVRGAVAKRGDRLVTTRRLMPSADGAVQDQEISVRRTAAVEALLEFTAKPRPVINVLGQLATLHSLDRTAGLGVIRDLVSAGLLRTGLLPETGSGDHLAELVARLHRLGLHRHAAELEEIAATARDVEPGDVAATWNDLRERMNDVPGSTGDQLARPDLGWSRELRLPRPVAIEAAAVATTLARLFAKEPRTTVELREWFLNTHGVDRLVPVRELLDDHATGPVATLLDSEDSDHGQTPAWRLRMLAELLSDSLRNDAREVRLDDRLASFTRPERETAPAPVVSADLFCRLVARTATALEAGTFLLVEPRFGPGAAGATFTRFAPLLTDTAAAVGNRVRQARPRTETAVFAEVVFEPAHARTRNVLASPSWLDMRLCIDRPAEDPSEVDLDDLLVGATREGMYLLSKRLGVPVVPVLHSRMNRQLAPAAVRLLLAIGEDDCAQVHGWSWGPLAAAPFLPRVVLGRAVLSPATWRMPDGLIAAASSDDDLTWARLVREWRITHDVPQRVLVGVGDRRVPLDLERYWDLLVLRREITTREVRSVCEFIGDDEEDGWFGETGRAHVTELVIPMFSTDTLQRRAPALVSRAIHAGADTISEPGGEYLSIEIDVPSRSQNHVLLRLRDVLEVPMVAAGVDRWFFLRYHRIGYVRRPHLRVRFHGPADGLAATLLPAWHDVAIQLRADGLVGDWRIVPYNREVERYGGPALFADVEKLFHADSEAIVHTLRAEQPGLHGSAVLAVSAAELASHLDPDGVHSQWLSNLHGHPDTALRPEVRALVAGGDLGARLGREADSAWARRREMASAVGQRVRTVEEIDGCWSSPERIYESIVHLHCNRMAGIAPEIEHQALRLAHDALEYRARAVVATDA
ncbi:lantibiotic dehydratase [Jiangella alkaliphila]|uniref:Thiopeptide-type bacteriocin biosynthesis domain-containing protein n=1 Tax=Jiangella alkaliphila TaxID=419479 RepID=A0A1H2GD83_9ACTN|nr:lantibiotic dehydratase [Jiangella alkaliphila]SDU17696.1 thiopeptide-type bacteriocin biosynthesis domain-containing protein [Jiangella alkaliphila]